MCEGVNLIYHSLLGGKCLILSRFLLADSFNAPVCVFQAHGQ